MAYTVTHSNGDFFRQLSEGEVNQSLGGPTSTIYLIGQNVHNYGQYIADNFLHLLENQASDVSPNNPQEGQLWWDTRHKVLHFFDGEKYKSCSSSEVSVDPPLRPLDGDQWWDLTNHQLNVFDGTAWIVIGPGFKKGQNFSGIEVVTVTDTAGLTHIVTLHKVDGKTVYITSKDEAFMLSTVIDGIQVVGKGISLFPTAIVNGTAANSMQLNNIAASDYVVRTSPVVTLDGSLHVNGLAGVIAGNVSLSRIGVISTDSLTLAVNATGLTISDNGIELSKEPLTDKSATTKLYVDAVASELITNSHQYTDARFNAAVGSSPIPSLSSLSAAIGNDPLFYETTNAKFLLKADLLNPVFIGSPQAPTLPGTDTSERLATTRHVKHALDHAAITFTNANTDIAGQVTGNVLTFDGAKWVSATPVTTGNGKVRLNVAGVVRGDTGYVNYSNSTIDINLSTSLSPPTSTGGVTTYYKTDVNVEGRVVGGNTVGVPWVDVTGRPTFIDSLATVNGIVAKTPTDTRTIRMVGTAGQIVITNPAGLTAGGSIVDPIFSLADTTVTPGDYGNVQRIAVDNKGRVTSIVASPYDSSNRLMTAKIFDIKAKVAWWFAGIGSSITQWNGVNSNFYNQFLNISSTTYRNHPLYNAAGHYGTYFYASSVAAQTQYEFTCPQPTRILHATGIMAKISNNYTITDAFYYRVDRFDVPTNTWIPVPNTDDGSWTKVTKSDGSFNGYLSVAADFAYGANVKKTRDFSLTIPNDFNASVYYESGAVYSPIFQSELPPLPANTKYRMTIQVYCVSNSAYATLAELSQRTTYTLKGE